jgi:hypothetical protein
MTMRLIQVGLVLLISTAGTNLPAQQPAGPAARKIGQVLMDFRLDRPVTSVRIPAATQRAVLSKMFRRYLTDENKCNRDFATKSEDYLKAARTAGQIAPSIVDTATGSFTAAGQMQTAYLVSVSECNASHADNFGTKRLAIFSGQQMVADIDVDFKSSIIRKTDLDGDGVDELLMTTGDMNQGTEIEMGGLLEFRNGRMRVIEDFGPVYEDSCGTAMPGSTAQAVVLSVLNGTAGRMPKLKIDNYETKCRKTRRWRFVSTGKRQ